MLISKHPSLHDWQDHDYSSIYTVLLDWLIDRILFLSRSRVFQSFRNITIAGEGLRNLSLLYALSLRPLSMEESLPCKNCYDMDLVYTFSSERPPCSVAKYNKPSVYLAFHSIYFHFIPRITTSCQSDHGSAGFRNESNKGIHLLWSQKHNYILHDSYDKVQIIVLFLISNTEINILL